MYRNKISGCIISHIDNINAHESYFQINSKAEYSHLAANPKLSTELWFKVATKSNIDTAIALATGTAIATVICYCYYY